MSLSTIHPGDRIRMVTFLVATVNSDGSFNRPRKVNVRYNWTGVDPEHTCVADTCPFCDAEVLRSLRPHLDAGTVVTGMTALRDGQTTMGRPAKAAKVKAAA